MTFQSIESGGGEAQLLSKLQQELKEKTYRAQAVRRVYIPKGDGTNRPLGIPTIGDRVAQMAVKIVMEPIFEADFEDCPVLDFVRRKTPIKRSGSFGRR